MPLFLNTELELFRKTYQTTTVWTSVTQALIEYIKNKQL